MITTYNDLFVTDVSFFEEIDTVLNYIKTNANNKLLESIRSEKDKDKKNKLKQKLKCYCFSGKFSKRRASSIIEHSGFACLDFDGYKDEKDATAIREGLKDNEFIYSAFISPSGKGVKAIIKIPPEINNHKKYYEAICETFDCHIDSKTKDVSRVCYESYDKDLWINKDSKTWTLKKEYKEVSNNSTYPNYFTINDKDKRVNIIKTWFSKTFNLSIGERNNNLYKFACALNKAGLPQKDCVQTLISEYSSGLPESEINILVKSAYTKHTSEHGQMTLIDDNAIHRVRQMMDGGEDKAIRKLKREGVSTNDIDEIIDFDFEEDYAVFWRRTKAGKVSLDDLKFKLFLENRGFYKVNLNEKEYTFVKVYNNRIREISEIAIKDFVMDYVRKIDREVYNFLAGATSKFTDKYLNLLETKHLNMQRDTATETFLFFQNTIVKVTPTKIELIDYMNCKDMVWENNIIPHNFKETNVKSDFETFISNLSAQDKERKTALESAMGYLINGFKKGDEGKALVLTDQTLNDNPSGRTGKTVISHALGQIRKVTTINGKAFDGKSQFPYDTVSLDDNIICFDDMDRNFKFESLFCIVTGDLVLNKKNLQPVIVPYSRSPKILFTTNYPLKGEGDSHSDRKIELELYRHYSASHHPIKEFGKRFFEDWNEAEFHSFFCYMIRNVQLYYKKGLIQLKSETSEIRKFISNTGEDFYDFCNHYPLAKTWSKAFT